MSSCSAETGFIPERGIKLTNENFLEWCNDIISATQREGCYDELYRESIFLQKRNGIENPTRAEPPAPMDPPVLGDGNEATWKAMSMDARQAAKAWFDYERNLYDNYQKTRVNREKAFGIATANIALSSKGILETAGYNGGRVIDNAYDGWIAVKDGVINLTKAKMEFHKCRSMVTLNNDLGILTTYFNRLEMLGHVLSDSDKKQFILASAEAIEFNVLHNLMANNIKMTAQELIDKLVSISLSTQSLAIKYRASEQIYETKPKWISEDVNKMVQKPRITPDVAAEKLTKRKSRKDTDSKCDLCGKIGHLENTCFHNPKNKTTAPKWFFKAKKRQRVDEAMENALASGSDLKVSDETENQIRDIARSNMISSN